MSTQANPKASVSSDFATTACWHLKARWLAATSARSVPSPRIFGLLALLVLFMIRASAASPEPTHTALEPLAGDARALGFEIGATGHVVGTSVGALEEGALWIGVIWRDADAPVILRPLTEHPESSGRAINAPGRVAGDSGERLGSSPSPKRAVIWERDGTITVLPLPSGAPFSSAAGINARGQVVGRVYGGGFQQAVRWEPDGPVTLLSTPEPHVPPNHFFNAFAINDRGESAGLYHPEGPHRKPIVWDRDGIGHELETPPGMPNGEARSINNRGEAGGFVSPNLRTPIENFGAIWDARGRLRIAQPLPGHVESLVFDISDAGTAVGFSQGPDGQLLPVKWEAGGGAAVALNLPDGFAQGVALSINSRGQIEIQAFNILGEGTAFVLD